MFKRVFTFMTITVVCSILIASMSLMFFLVSFWKNDRFSRLSKDASSLSGRVLSIYERFPEIDLLANETGLLSDIFASVAGETDVDLFVVSGEGKVIFCRELTNVSAQENGICAAHSGLAVNEALLKSAFDASPQTYETQEKLFDGDECFISVACAFPTDGSAFYTVAAQKVSQAYLPFTTEFIRMFLVAELFGVFIAFIGALLASYRMVSPIKKMTRVTRQYAQGEFTERINTKVTYSELSEFAEAFNSMAESLERMEESRSLFVSNVSHELKTPMTIISGFIDGILDGTIPKEDEEKYLRIVSEETKRLSGLVVAMLNISKIEAGKLELSLVKVPLDRLVTATLLDFEQEIEKKRIEIKGLDKLTKAAARADETLIGQVIFNLVDNAVKFTPEEGAITVRLLERGSKAIFSIRNTGRGIPSEDAALIFERFYKVDRSRGLDAKSFGIGLFIVKRIVELHHGTIRVNSSENEFTEFTVSLPRYTEEA